MHPYILRIGWTSADDHMVRQHLGKAIAEPQRRRWVALLMDAADETGLPDEPEFRAAFSSYIEWGTRIALTNSQPDAKPPLEAPCRTGAGAWPRPTSLPGSSRT